jgi:hypothetical protein
VEHLIRVDAVRSRDDRDRGAWLQCFLNDSATFLLRAMPSFRSRGYRDPGVPRCSHRPIEGAPRSRN